MARKKATNEERGVAQLSLIPDRPPEGEVREIPIDELVGEGEGKLTLIGPDPDRSFIESVRMYGMRFPIELAYGDQGWVCEDGVRRLKAVMVLRNEPPSNSYISDFRLSNPAITQEADLERLAREAWRSQWSVVKAQVTPIDGSWHVGLLGLTLNEQRSENLAVALRQIEKFVRQGYDENAIWRATGVPPSRLRRIMALLNLVPELREAFEEGRIKPGIAERAAKCDTAQQKQLVAILAREGQVTGSDVREVRKANQRAIQDALEGVGDQMQLGENWWLEDAMRKLREVIAMAPDGDAIVEPLRAMIDELDGRQRQVSRQAALSVVPDDSDNEDEKD